MSSSEKVALYIADCRRMGIVILPPDVNESDINFTVVDSSHIRFGLAAVKNVGRGAIEAIIETRSKEGKFTSLHDFCSKVDLRTCNRKVLESLIKSGAFDSLGGARSQYLNILDDAMNYGHQLQKDRSNGQISMFTYLGETGDLDELDDLGITGDDLPPIPEFSPKEKLALEKEMVGLYISGHPLDQYRLILDNLRGVVPLAELRDLGERRDVSIAGMISSVRSIYTKKGRPMSFLKVEDFTGEVEVIVFSDLHERYQSDLQEDRVVLIKGYTDFKEEEEVRSSPKRSLFPLPRPCS